MYVFKIQHMQIYKYPHNTPSSRSWRKSSLSTLICGFVSVLSRFQFLLKLKFNMTLVEYVDLFSRHISRFFSFASLPANKVNNAGGIRDVWIKCLPVNVVCTTLGEQGMTYSPWGNWTLLSSSQSSWNFHSNRRKLNRKSRQSERWSEKVFFT
jgi:hypothetical protein